MNFGIYVRLFKVLEDLHTRYYALVSELSTSELDHVNSSRNLPAEADIKVGSIRTNRY